MSTLRAFFRLLIPVKATGFYYPFWMIGTIYDVSMGILEPVFTAWILTSIIAKDIHGLYFAIAIFAGAKILQQIVGFCMEFVKSRCINSIEISVENTFFRRFIQFESTKAELYGTGKIMSLSNKGVWQWVAILMDVIPDMIAQILMIIVGFVIISSNVPLSYLVFITALFTGNVALTIFAQKKASASRIQGSRMNSEIDRKRTQIIMSKFEILQNNKIDRELSLLSAMINKMGDFWIQSIRITASADSLAIFGTNILHIGIYLVIGIGVIRGEYQLATLVLLSGIVFNLLSYVWGVQRTLGKFFDAFVHIEQLWETLDSTPIYHKSKDQSEFYFKNGSIALKNITFSYTPESPVFKNFSLTLEWGKKYALVGPSGGGKTTLVKILSGYIVPDSGEIRIDGQSLSDTLLVSYYRHIGYLTQDPSVFDGTIVDNLIYALHDDDLKDLSARIRKVLLLAKCDFVYDFPKGIETEIGERGVRLSGGQKQRLAIAKIMLKNPKIIFLDEPTSALDSFNEEEVTIALGNLFAGRTVVVVAHRLQTVQSADTIFYIENGKVLESWNHQSLIALGGPYKKMLDLQSGF